MIFNSIKDVLDHFNIETSDPDKLKRKLKKLIKHIHPDTNNGEFKSDEDKKTFMEIQSALEFLEITPRSEIVLRNEITELTKIVKDLSTNKTSQILKQDLEQKNTYLESKIKDSVILFNKEQSTTKLTSIIVTTALTALWAFPSLVKDHPLLKFLYEYNREFTVIWLNSLVLTGLVWTKIKRIEKKDELLKRKYRLESTQNTIFDLFLLWLETDYNNYDFQNDIGYLKFSKDQLIHFLLDKYQLYDKALGNYKMISKYELSRKIKEIEENIDYYKSKNHLTVYSKIFPRPGEIDLEIAQTICDLIIDRLLSKELVQVFSKKSLSDIYLIKKDY